MQETLKYLYMITHLLYQCLFYNVWSYDMKRFNINGVHRMNALLNLQIIAYRGGHQCSESCVIYHMRKISSFRIFV